MTLEQFDALYDDALDRAESELVVFTVRPGQTNAWSWQIADWSPVRSAAVDDQIRVYYHVLALEAAYGRC